MNRAVSFLFGFFNPHILQIVAVEIRKPGFQTGYIVIRTAEAISTGKHWADKLYDENTISIGPFGMGKVREFKALVDRAVSSIAAGSSHTLRVGDDAAEQIARYKKLLDDGAITQTEYDAKKKQLLGLDMVERVPIKNSPTANPTMKTTGPVGKIPIIVILAFIAVSFIGWMSDTLTSDRKVPTVAVTKDKQPIKTIEHTIENQPSLPTISVFHEAEQFSRISEEQLVDLRGEPNEKEDWTYNYTYQITTYRYFDGDICFEYHFCTNEANEKPLGSMTIAFNYQGDGSNLGSGLDDDIFARLGISPYASMKKVADTGVAIRWTNVSAKIYEVHAMSVGNDDKMADWVKIRFDYGFPL